MKLLNNRKTSQHTKGTLSVLVEKRIGKERALVFIIVHQKVKSGVSAILRMARETILVRQKCVMLEGLERLFLV